MSMYVSPSTSSGFPSASTSLSDPSFGIISILFSFAILDFKMSIVAPVSGNPMIFTSLPSLLHLISTLTVGVFSPLRLHRGLEIFPFEDNLAMMSKSAVRAMFPCLHVVGACLGASVSESEETVFLGRLLDTRTNPVLSTTEDGLRTGLVLVIAFFFFCLFVSFFLRVADVDEVEAVGVGEGGVMGVGVQSISSNRSATVNMSLPSSVLHLCHSCFIYSSTIVSSMTVEIFSLSPSLTVMSSNILSMSAGSSFSESIPSFSSSESLDGHRLGQGDSVLSSS